MYRKDCGNHGFKRKELYRRLFACFLAFVILVLFIILVIWLALRPTKPRFSLLEATVNQFNVSTPNLLTSQFQVTIQSRNPNDRIGIYYDRLDVYASYINQQITIPTRLPTTYQGHNDVSVWSPFLTGITPVAPYVTATIQQQENAGFALISFKIDGRLRWKVGTWISGHYHIHVNCNAYMAISSSNGNGYQFTVRPSGPCNTDV